MHLLGRDAVAGSHVGHMGPDDTGGQNDGLGLAEVSELLRHHERIGNDEDQHAINAALGSRQSQIG